MFCAWQTAQCAGAVALCLLVGCHVQSPEKATPSDPCHVEERPAARVTAEPRITLAWADFFPAGYPPPSERPPIDLGTLEVARDRVISSGGSVHSPLLRVAYARIAPPLAPHLSAEARRAWDRRNATRKRWAMLVIDDHPSSQGCVNRARESHAVATEALSKALGSRTPAQPADTILRVHLTEPFVTTADDCSMPFGTHSLVASCSAEAVPAA